MPASPGLNGLDPDILARARLIDMHSHWGTRRGYPLRTPEQLAKQRHAFNSEPRYVTEDEMADELRQAGVAAILDFGFTGSVPLDEVAALHDYGFAVQSAHRDVILGHWLHIDPRLGAAGVAEFRRCLEAAPGFAGICVSGSTMGVPATDPLWEPFYQLSTEANVPVLILVGTTAAGAGLPGGGGLILDHCHPRYLDAVAATHPDLTIIAGRPAWPWQAEMIAILLHKPNVWYELHGWSPRYHTAELKHDIPRRLKSRVMFGADYPLISYERLVREWRAEEYSEDVLEAVFRGNALRLLTGTGD
jgi:hypothetical protein